MNSLTRPTYANQAREKLISSTKTRGNIELSHQNFQKHTFYKIFFTPHLQ